MPEHLVCLTFDHDTASANIARGLVTPTMISRGDFGIPATERILKLLEKYSIATTWFVPGHTIENYPYHDPACGGFGLGKTKPFFNSGISSHEFRRLVYRGPTRIANPSRLMKQGDWRSLGPCNGTFDDDPRIDVLPECHEKLAGKSDNRRFLLTTAV